MTFQLSITLRLRQYSTLRKAYLGYSVGTPWIKRDDAAGDRANSTQIFSDGNLPAATSGRDANVVELCITSSMEKTESPRNGRSPMPSAANASWN